VHPLLNKDEEQLSMVAHLRTAFGRHIDDPVIGEIRLMGSGFTSTTTPETRW
jgi:hypothetical protein